MLHLRLIKLNHYTFHFLLTQCIQSLIPESCHLFLLLSVYFSHLYILDGIHIRQVERRKLCINNISRSFILFHWVFQITANGRWHGKESNKKPKLWWKSSKKKKEKNENYYNISNNNNLSFILRSDDYYWIEWFNIICWFSSSSYSVWVRCA